MLDDLPISRIGYGCYALSGAYGNRLDINEKINIIKEAYNLGVRLFDTAASYDDTEIILGKALNLIRDEIVIMSKVNVSGSHSNLTKDNVIHSCENSLRNLNTDYIDIFQIHFDDPQTPIEETIAAFEQLKKDGKIRYYGIGHLPLNRTKEYLNKSNTKTVLAEMSAVSLYRYHELKSLFKDNDFKIIAFSVTGRGLLSMNFNQETQFNSNDIRSVDPLFKKHKLDFGLKIRNYLKMIGDRLSLSSVQVAILWVLEKERILSALIGPTKINHLKENISIMNQSLDCQIMIEIDKFINREQQVLDTKLKKDTIRVLHDTTCSNVLQSFDDIVGVLEYTLENNTLPYEIGVELYQKLLVSRKKGVLTSKFLNELRKQILESSIKY